MIAAVELGRRRLTLGELAVLPLILVEADVTGGRLLTLEELIPVNEDLVSVGPGLKLPLSVARALLLERGSDNWTVAPAKPVIVGADRRVLEADSDAEQKAASTLRVSPEAIVQAAHQLWGRSLTAERENRVDAYTAPMLKLEPDKATEPGWPRRLQAIRGHVTRELLGELRPLLKDTKKGRRK
jgi:hypothetical protein